MNNDERKGFENLKENQFEDSSLNPDDYIEQAIEFTTTFQDDHDDLLDHAYDDQLSGLFMAHDDMLDLLNNFLADNDDNEDIIQNAQDEIKKVKEIKDNHLMKVTLGDSDAAIDFQQMEEHAGEDKMIVKRVNELDKVTAFNIVQDMVSDYQDELDW